MANRLTMAEISAIHAELGSLEGSTGSADELLEDVGFENEIELCSKCGGQGTYESLLALCQTVP